MTIRISTGKVVVAGLVLAVAAVASFSAFQRYQQVQRLEAFASTHHADKALIDAYANRVRGHHYIVPMDQRDMGELLQSFGPAAIYRLNKAIQAADA